MNVTDFTYLINKPEAVNQKQTEALDKVLMEFPYFQAARALQLKGLYNQDSFQYNTALKVTAAHTTDRTVLFDFITSNTFVAVQKGLYDKKVQELLNIGVVDHEIIASDWSVEPKINSLEQSILSSIKESSDAKEETETVSDTLDIGKPLEFSTNEKHSFQEWLQLSRIQPIVRENSIKINSGKDVLDNDKKKKAEIIDKFIETSPKISPIRTIDSATIIKESNPIEPHYLMTETLARVYLEQKKYQRAIQAYEILILKYPEKSSLFANRISDIEILQQNNT